MLSAIFRPSFLTVYATVRLIPERELTRGLFRVEKDLGAVAKDDVIRMAFLKDTDDDPVCHDETPVTAERAAWASARRSKEIPLT
ncbi:MAG TPA: hypothetical protein VID28_05455 [Methylomirabilota bacterium]|jgi:hypothetical protein